MIKMAEGTRRVFLLVWENLMRKTSTVAIILFCILRPVFCFFLHAFCYDAMYDATTLKTGSNADIFMTPI